MIIDILYHTYVQHSHMYKDQGYNILYIMHTCIRTEAYIYINTHHTYIRIKD